MEKMCAFGRFSRYFLLRFLNGGTVLVVMGIGWLYLWLVPWYQAYVDNPHWGHNYAEAAAFLALGLAYFNRRIVTDAFAFIATLLIIPAALELIPHLATAITSAGILLLTVLDMLVERKRGHDLWQPSSQRLAFWLKKHLPRFSYIMLAHIEFIYFLVRLPTGTYETELVTKVFDGMMIPFVLMLLMEDMAGIVNGELAKRAAFFWGTLTTIVSLVILADQLETYPVLAITIVITVVGIVALRTKQVEDGEAPITKPNVLTDK
ncbi:hypothetical protein ACFLWG_01720 [Chloroflexota bacterium]